MINRFVTIAVLMLLSASFASAQSNSISSGINWLIANQNADKSWGSSTSAAVLPFHSTIEAVTALKTIGEVGLSYSDAMNWLNTQSIDSANFASNRLVVRASAGLDTSTELSQILSMKNTDGYWGLDGDYVNEMLNTGLALQALKAVNYSNSTLINNVITYLLSNQNSDGGFGFYQGDASNVYMTAMVFSTLQQFPQTTSLATAINKATAFLIAHQNADGGFGSSATTVYETALSYIALVGAITDNTVLGNAINYLTTNQFSDGSWNQDPYNATPQKHPPVDS